jgi:hypothetical protein
MGVTVRTEMVNIEYSGNPSALALIRNDQLDSVSRGTTSTLDSPPANSPLAVPAIHHW